jgi:PAS domain S-box-containing protein
VPQLGFLILVSLLNFALGVLVYSRNTSHWVNRSFALFAFSIAGWSITQVTRLAGTEPALLWARLAFVMAGVSIYAMVLFFQVFPFRKTLPTSWPIRILGASACAFALFAMLSPWIVSSATRSATGRTLTYGPLYDAFATYVLCCGVYSLLTIIRTTRAARGAERQQLKYLFVAVVVPGAFAISTNLVVPLMTGSSALSQYGPLFSVVMIAMIAHAIIRHRLMDVQLFIRQGVVYGCAIATAAVIFFVLVEIFRQAMRRESESIPLLEALAFAVIVAIVFQPLKGWINTSFNRYLYRHTYDYQQIIREASRTLSTTLTLEPLIEYLAAVIEQAFRVDFVAVYVLDQPGRALARHFYHATPEYKASAPPPSIAGHSAILRYLSDKREPLVREEAVRISTDDSIVAAAGELASLGGDIAVPLLRDQSLVGLVAIGAKRSGDPFFGQDLDLLSTLTGQAAVAMQNAQLYQQVVLANEYVENILRTMDSGVITVDAAGKVALCNSTAARLTGLSRDRLSTLDVDNLPLPLGFQLRETLADGHPRSQAETTLSNEGDRRIPLVCSTSALRDERGAVIGALIVFSDLSKIKALESEKRRAERLASFGSLVAGIAHEIKNPLVAIKTFAELLPERFSDIDFRDDFSKVVKSEIDRIDGLVGRLRGLATPTPGALAAIDIREPISDTLALLRGQFEQTQTLVHRDLGASEVFVSIDPAQAKQLFLNLFLNAIEAMAPGGHLTVNLTRVTHQGVAWVRVAIIDTGGGIPESIRAKIFEPFFTTKTRGSGLGLAICRSIADAHKGTVRVETPSGSSGTTVVLEFPLATAQARLKEQSVLLR